MYKTTEANFETKLKKLKSRKGEEFKSFRFLKAVAEAVNIIIEKDIKKLNWKDYTRIATKVYKKNDIITISRVKNMLKTDIAKNMIDNQLVAALNKANLSIERLPELYKKVEKYADEKKDGNLVLKLAEKVEKAHQLEAKLTEKTVEKWDFSAIDQEPVKVSETKIIEKTVSKTADVPAKSDLADENV